MSYKSTQNLSVTDENTKLLLPKSPEQTIFGKDFDPRSYTEKVVEINGKLVETPLSKFPLTLVQKSGNLLGGISSD